MHNGFPSGLAPEPTCNILAILKCFSLGGANELMPAVFQVAGDGPGRSRVCGINHPPVARKNPYGNHCFTRTPLRLRGTSNPRAFITRCFFDRDKAPTQRNPATLRGESQSVLRAAHKNSRSVVPMRLNAHHRAACIAVDFRRTQFIGTPPL